MSVKKILISQQQPMTASPYTSIAEKFGVEFDFKPFFKIEPLTSREFRSQRINILDHTAIVFSARQNAALENALTQLDLAIKSYEMGLFVVGLTTELTRWSRMPIFLLTAAFSCLVLIPLYSLIHKIGLIGGNTWKE